MVDITYPLMNEHDFGEMQLVFEGCGSMGLEHLACIVRGQVLRLVPKGHHLVLDQCWVNGKEDDGKLRDLLQFLPKA